MVSVTHDKLRVADLPQKVRHGGLPRHSNAVLTVWDEDGLPHSGQFVAAETSHARFDRVWVTLQANGRQWRVYAPTRMPNVQMVVALVARVDIPVDTKEKRV